MSSPSGSGQIELNIEVHADLVYWLAEQGLTVAGTEVISANLVGGVSNRTVRARYANRDLIIKQALAKLRVDDDWFAPTDRIISEFLALDVYQTFVPGRVPAPVCQDPVRNIIAMEAVPEPHQNWKTMLLGGVIELGCWRKFGAMLAQVHEQARSQVASLPARLQSKAHFHSLRLEPYYRVSGRRVPQAAEFMDELVEAATTSRYTLVHGDYSPKNILVQNGHLWLLDFEVCHVGTPWFDVGFALTHALAKALWSREHRHIFLQAAEEFWFSYAQGSGSVARQDGGEGMACKHVLGCLLARAVGRSRLEYLNPSQLHKQQTQALQLIAQPPTSVIDLIKRYGRALGDT